MKGHLQLMVIFTVFLIGLPFIALLSDRHKSRPAAAQQETVLMLFGGDTEPTELTMKQYIMGAVAAQMPADFDIEALKAQAVLAHTYALRRRAEEELSPAPALRGADLSDDSTLYNAYFTESQIRSLYSGELSEVREKLSAAAEYGMSRVLVFEGEPIIAAFHAISFGRTLSAQTAWNERIPYLTGADSSWDADNERTVSELRAGREALYSQLKAAFPDTELSEDSLTVKITERTEEGCAATVELCGSVYVSGRQFADAAGLPSVCFEVSEDGEGFLFTCRGRGHLVGMSQYGAQSMAERGCTAEEILSHYFKNAELRSTEESK